MRNCARHIDCLLARIQQGDAIAFEKVYFLIVPSVRAFISSRNSRDIPVDDLTQEVFCRLWQQRSKYRGEASGLTYVMGIAINVCREYVRSVSCRRRMPIVKDEVFLQAATLPMESDLEKDELEVILREARNELSEIRATAIHLVYDLELSPKKAAEIVRCTEKAFRLRLDAARHQLEQYLYNRVPHLFKGFHPGPRVQRRAANETFIYKKQGF